MKDLSHPLVPPLVPVILAMVTGILAGNISSHAHLLLAVLCFAVLAALFLAGFFYRRWLIFWICLLAGIWSGYQSFYIHSPILSSGHVSLFYNDPDIRVVGRIVSFSRKYPHKIRVVLDCQKIVTTDPHFRTICATGRLYLNVYGKTDHSLKFHDLIQCTGPIRPIRNFGNPGAFDYQTFLKRQGIFGAVHTGADKITMVSEEKSFVFIRLIQALENTRNRFHHFVMTHLDHQDSAHVLAALVTGIKQQMPAQIKDVFARSGASHLLAISGLHLGILSVIFFCFFYWILSCFPQLLISAKARKAAGILALVPLGLYAVFCGFSPSTQRAFIMISMFMFSFSGEKQSHPVNTLAGAGILILLADPGALFSISFQLSFTAVLFIISGLGIAGKYQKPAVPKILKYPASICLVTVLAGIGTFPLIARYFNMISMVQLPANLLLVPLIGFVCLPLGLVSLLAWPLFPGVSGVLLTMAAKLVSFCLAFLAWLTEPFFAWSHVPSLSVYDMVAIYTAMGAGFCLLSFKKTKPVIMLCTAVITIAGVYGIQKVTRTRDPGHMVITVLDVGQGNAALIQTIEGKNMLVDGGGFPGTTGFDTGRHVVAPFLWQQRIMALDAVILTHPDSDHMNGLVFILENFKVATLVTNGDNSFHDAFARIMAVCDRRQIPVFVPNCNKKQIIYDKTNVAFFQCASVLPGLDPNDNSLVFTLKLQDFSMLFPGDIMKTREKLLAQVLNKNLVSSILLAPHHGSNTSSTKFFLDKINPESVIISCGFNNRYKFPHPDVLERYRQRGMQVFRTDTQGAVTITSSGNGYTIATHKGG
mgnify:CR=1 FL=1